MTNRSVVVARGKRNRRGIFRIFAASIFYEVLKAGGESGNVGTIFRWTLELLFYYFAKHIDNINERVRVYFHPR